MIFMAAGRAIRFSMLVAAVFCRAVRGLPPSATTVPQNNHPPLRMAAAAIPAAETRLMLYSRIFFTIPSRPFNLIS